MNPASTVRCMLNRMCEASAAGVGLAVPTPLQIAVAIAVRVGLGNPVLLAQERAGLRGRPFTLLKFRTMREPRRGDGAPVESEEARLTPLGRRLRRANLDELPQL